MVFVYSLDKSKLSSDAAAVRAFKNQVVLAFSSHADDLSIAAGGLLAQLAEDNKVVPVLAYTGWRGVPDQSDRQSAIDVREQEMKGEAAAVGLFNYINKFNEALGVIPE